MLNPSTVPTARPADTSSRHARATTREWSRRLLTATLVAGGLFLMLASTPVRASAVGQTRKLGIGVVVGQPSGITVKYYLTAMHSFAAQLGIGWLDGYHFRANLDYNLNLTVARTVDFDIPIYFGAGLSVFGWFEYQRWYFWGGDPGQYRSQLGFGLRVPVGVSLTLNKIPFEAFGEVAGGFGFFPRLGGYFDGLVGIRYYF